MDKTPGRWRGGALPDSWPHLLLQEGDGFALDVAIQNKYPHVAAGDGAQLAFSSSCLQGLMHPLCMAGDN